MVKKKLFALLRTKVDNNWPKWIKVITETINNTVNSKHGFRPVKVAHEIFDEKVREAMMARDKYHRQNLDDVIKRYKRYRKSDKEATIYEDDVVQFNQWHHGLEDYYKSIKKVNIYFCIITSEFFKPFLFFSFSELTTLKL